MSIGQLIKFVGIGYICGFGVIFAIPIILMLFSDPSSYAYGNAPPHPLALLVMFATILTLQAIIISIIVAFGHWIFRRFSSIDIELSK